MRARGWIWAAALAGLAVFSAVRLASGRAMETDLLAMLPDTEKNPVAELAIQALLKTTQERVVLLVKGQEAALALAKDLEDSRAFAEVQSTLPPVDPGELTRFYAPYRFRLAPPDLPRGELGPVIESHLSAPMFTGLSPALDPLGTFGAHLARLPFQSTGLEMRNGLLTIPSPQGTYILITAGLKGSAFDPVIQAQATGAVRSAEKHLASAFPGTEVLRTGVIFYAADARQSAEREMNLISLLSMLAIFGLYALVFRSPRHFLLGLACVAAGLIAAVSVCLIVFGKLHLLTLVCGSCVMGVSVDYCFLYFAHHLGAGPAWEPRSALRRLMPALLLGLGTTLLGYAALLAAPFPGLRQIAVFSIVGLAGAFATVLLVLPDWLQAPMTPRPRLMAWLEGLLARARAWSGSRGLHAALAGVLVLLAACLYLGRVDDDVHGLILPSRTLRLQETRIQELLKISTAGAFFLVEGDSPGQVLVREEALRARPPIPGAGSLMAVSSFVPSPQRQEDHLARNLQAAPALKKGMLDAGFRPEAVSRALEDLRTGPLTVDAYLATTFSIPFRPFWLGRTAHGYASIILPTGAPESAALKQAASGLPGVTLVDKAQSVTDLLGHYRRMAAWALAGAVLLVGLLLGAWYGALSSIRILAPAIMGMLAALAAGALLGYPVTLFTVMALILALGFGVDYTVFLKESGAAGTSALLGVGLASYGTLVSYGLLALSHTPALRGFGITLALAVLVSTLLSYLALERRA